MRGRSRVGRISSLDAKNQIDHTSITGLDHTSFFVHIMSVMVYVIWPLVASGIFLILLLLLPMGWLRPRVNAFLAKLVFFEWYGILNDACTHKSRNFNFFRRLGFRWHRRRH